MMKISSGLFIFLKYTASEFVFVDKKKNIME